MPSMMRSAEDSLTIKVLPVDDHPRAQQFYTHVGYSDLISPDALVVAAQYQGEMGGPDIIGVVRLCTEQGDLLLRGMMVDPVWQRQGIGSLMVRELENHIGSRMCYCLPHYWLSGFYGQIGFVPLPEGEVPAHLLQRLHRYRNGPYPHVIAMKRPA